MGVQKLREGGGQKYWNTVIDWHGGGRGLVIRRGGAEEEGLLSDRDEGGGVALLSDREEGEGLLSDKEKGKDLWSNREEEG